MRRANRHVHCKASRGVWPQRHRRSRVGERDVVRVGACVAAPAVLGARNGRGEGGTARDAIKLRGTSGPEDGVGDLATWRVEHSAAERGLGAHVWAVMDVVCGPLEMIELARRAEGGAALLETRLALPQPGAAATHPRRGNVTASCGTRARPTRLRAGRRQARRQQHRWRLARRRSLHDGLGGRGRRGQQPTLAERCNRRREAARLANCRAPSSGRATPPLLSRRCGVLGMLRRHRVAVARERRARRRARERAVDVHRERHVLPLIAREVPLLLLDEKVGRCRASPH